MYGFRDLGLGIDRGDLVLRPTETQEGVAAQRPELQVGALAISGPVYGSSAVPPTEGSRPQPAPSTQAGR
jgi:hypothetical protein